jgi:hypothetical protein
VRSIGRATRSRKSASPTGRSKPRYDVREHHSREVALPPSGRNPGLAVQESKGTRGIRLWAEYAAIRTTQASWAPFDDGTSVLPTPVAESTIGPLG